MSDPAVEFVLARLPREEGTRLIPYDDATGITVRAPKGHISWGRGLNLEQCGSVGLFEVMDRYLLEQHHEYLKRFSWYDIDSVRQSVLLDIAFNAGDGGLLKFPHMLAAVSRQDWVTASSECRVADERLDLQRFAPLRQILLTGMAP